MQWFYPMILSNSSDFERQSRHFFKVLQEVLINFFKTLQHSVDSNIFMQYWDIFWTFPFFKMVLYEQISWFYQKTLEACHIYYQNSLNWKLSD